MVEFRAMNLFASRSARTGPLALAAALAMSGLALSVPARAADHLNCIANDASPEAKQIFSGFQENFSTEGTEQSEASQKALQEYLGKRAATCAESNHWSEKAAGRASAYEMSSQLHDALLKHSPYDAAQTSKLVATLDASDQQRVRAIFEPIVEAQMAGKDAPELSDDAATFIVGLIEQAGLPLDGTSGQYVGMLLTAKQMQAIFAEKFAQL